MHLIYLHGFASSPASSKAQYLAARVSTAGFVLHCPDLNEPDFSTLTVSRMIAQVERVMAALDPGPVALIGSSLGAFVALHVADRRQRLADDHPIERLVLLAPAFDFGANQMKHLGPDGLEKWKTTNRLEVEHYAEGRARWIHYALYDDATRYDSFATTVTVPTFIVQGRFDAEVDPAIVERFVAGRAHATLRLFDDDHQLQAGLKEAWHEVAVFLGVSESGGEVERL